MILFPFLVALTVHALHIVAQQQVYGQCGGSGWTGQITCATGASCIKLNEWYSQCLPSSAPATTTPSTIMTVTTMNSNPPSSTGISGRAFRLLPLGDSITLGVSSSGGNGYRSTLHTLLEPGNTVDFIGSVKAGTMADNDNEGHNGASIEQIGSFSREAQALPARPNVILLKAGTVDVVFGIISGGPQRLATLIDSIFDTAPDVTLIVATITPIPSNQAAVNTYNEAVASLVNTRNAAGQHILLASMASVQSSDLADGLHPNDAGYLKMANAWFAAIQQADANGWIGQPAV